MRTGFRAALWRWTARITGLAALSALVAPAATAATEPPHFGNGFGLTVVSQPKWVDDIHRTLIFSVTTDQVPNPTLLPGQPAGQHEILVTLPADYGRDAATRYPVLYNLHGNPDQPRSLANKEMTERATQGVPLITVQPNGVRSWYSNWVNPGPAGPQNWETFHLDHVIPLIDANLRTISTRDGRAIAGHSMGGFGAFHYAEHRPDLFSYAGSFSGGLDLLNQVQRGAVVGTELLPESGMPIVGPDAIFGPPVWPLDRVWNEQSPAQHVESLRGMGVAMYTGNGGDQTDNPIQAVAEKVARDTNVVTAANLARAEIPYDFIDYGDGSHWAPGCRGKHADVKCLQADMDHYVSLIMRRLTHP